MATCLILGLGKINELSMDPHSIPKVKKILRMITIKEAQSLAERALCLKSAEEINKFITMEMRTRF